ncbi:MAG: hypothetical protein IT380_26175 [Myxococcales bacterium]|nr:hypothetical protein [Myxococcales bacterium]
MAFPAWAQLSLPYSGSTSANANAFEVTHLGSGSGYHAAIVGNASPDGFGVKGAADDGIGVQGNSLTGYGVGAFCGPQSYDPSNFCFGVYAATAANLPNATAVFASSAYGRTLTSVACGVSGENPTGGGFGVAGRTTGTGTGIYGENLSTGHAGYFIGKVHVAGNFSASAKNFRIDHPQDPANKILQHVSVESDDYKTIYDGVVHLDASGRATVPLPSWFESLNRDFRYQLTPIGAPASLFVQSEVQGGSFSIAGGPPNMKVSWQVTGLRKDAYANANPFQVEVQKSAAERGKYLNPELFGANAQRVLVTPPVAKASEP